MTTLQAKVQDLFARIPLLISFPTILLSSSYILQYNNNNKYNIFHDYNSLLINCCTLPLFLSSTILFILYQFNIITKSNNIKDIKDIKDSKDSKDNSNTSLILSIFIFNVVLFQSNWLLKPILTGCIVLVTLRQLQYSKNNNNNNSHWNNTIKSFIPLCLLQFIIQYCLMDSTDNLLISIINIVSMLAIRFNQVVFKFIHSKISLSLPSIQWVETTILYFIPIISFSTLIIQSTIDTQIELQFLMIIIFIGCAVLMTLSINDIINHGTIENNDININSNKQLLLLDIKNNFISCIGIMSIVLQYLSFTSSHMEEEQQQQHNLILTIVTIVFVIIAEYSSRNYDSIPHNNHDHHKPLPDDLNANHNKSILIQIATNKDTRSIFSFLLLNATFMFVQLLYSFRSRSLGLLSDSLHMALDCTSLLLGLIARVLSTTSIYHNQDKFPFKLNYLESLAGFTNGILLIGIVCGIFIQAFERIINPIHIHGTNELIVVSVLGLLVNLVGLFVFETGHHHGGDDDDNDSDNASNNENMKGIFLHILADTLGSVGVVISTLLIKLTGWHIFDPIASIMIASLILLSSIPLLKLTTETILLKLDTRKHNMVKQVLNQIIQTPGITGYTTPRFWPYSPDKVNHGHSHSHESHEHEHEHGHDHSHEQEHSHEHSHNNEHSHQDKNAKKQILMGYIHIQYVEGENSTIIKKRVEKIFENIGIKAWIQVEPANGTCWCRQASMANQPISQIVNTQ